MSYHYYSTIFLWTDAYFICSWIWSIFQRSSLRFESCVSVPLRSLTVAVCLPWFWGYVVLSHGWTVRNWIHVFSRLCGYCDITTRSCCSFVFDTCFEQFWSFVFEFLIFFFCLCVSTFLVGMNSGDLSTVHTRRHIYFGSHCLELVYWRDGELRWVWLHLFDGLI